MRIKPSAYKGWRFVREYQIGSGQSFEFAFTIESVLVRQRGRFRKRMLRPVNLLLIVLVRRKGKLKKRYFSIIGIKLFGHPRQQWHPHITTASDGSCSICWGRGGVNRLHHSRSLKRLLDDYLWRIIGILADFTETGTNKIELVRKVWTYPVHKSRRDGFLEKLNRIESFPENCWEK